MNRSGTQRTAAVSPTAFDNLAFKALFSAARERSAARREIRRRAAAAGIRTASLSALYEVMGTGAVHGFTVPAINVRGLSYDFIRAIFRAAARNRVGPFIIEIARSEMHYGEQTTDDLVVMALCAALRERFAGPLFIQGDHFQVDPSKSVDEEVAALERLIDASVAAGMGHIDIDASKTVDLSKRKLNDQQARNVELTAHFTEYIRERHGDDVLIGGEIGEIGGRVSTSGDLRAFMSQYRTRIGDVRGIGKIAVQTGTSHGGTPNRDGSLQKVIVDVDALENLSRLAREEFGLAGAVQHGASTLTERQIAQFPSLGVAEVHLSSGFQNIVFDHPSFPRQLREEIYAYLFAHFADLRKTGMTDQQFIYKQRKRAWGPFKKAIASLPGDVRRAIVTTLEQKVGSLFNDCKVNDTRPLIKKYIH